MDRLRRRRGPQKLPAHPERGSATERGQVLPLMAIVLVVTVGILMVAVRVSELLTASARARTAADAAALAGAASGEAEARAVARANDGELLRFDRTGQVVEVVVRVGAATHEARAEAVTTWEIHSAVG